MTSASPQIIDWKSLTPLFWSGVRGILRCSIGVSLVYLFTTPIAHIRVLCETFALLATLRHFTADMGDHLHVRSVSNDRVPT